MTHPYIKKSNLGFENSSFHGAESTCNQFVPDCLPTVTACPNAEHQVDLPLAHNKQHSPSDCCRKMITASTDQ